MPAMPLSLRAYRTARLQGAPESPHPRARADELEHPCYRSISALLIGGWRYLRTGGIAAFISGIGKITERCGDLVNYFRDANLSQIGYAPVRHALRQQARD